jgi:hypothetical protein
LDCVEPVDFHEVFVGFFALARASGQNSGAFVGKFFKAHCFGPIQQPEWGEFSGSRIGGVMRPNNSRKLIRPFSFLLLEKAFLYG